MKEEFFEEPHENVRVCAFGALPSEWASGTTPRLLSCRRLGLPFSDQSKSVASQRHNIQTELLLVFTNMFAIESIRKSS